jgi:ribosome-associated protein
MPRRSPAPPSPPADDATDVDAYDGPSRSQRKRDAHAHVELGDALLELSPAELDALDLDERLRDAIDLCRTITAHGGRARQRAYVGKLLRKTDVEPIRAALAARADAHRQQARAFHRLEAWRDRLVAEGEPAVVALLEASPGLDAARLRARVADARAEQAAGRAPAAARELFRWLRDSLDAPPPGDRTTKPAATDRDGR